jgi:hypothetical protein
MDKIEEHIVSQVIQGEWTGSDSLAQLNEDEFLSYVGLIDSVRDEKNYDWQSNIRIPEFASQMLTQSSIDVDQYFKTRDFVEVYLQDESDEAKASSAATKELINRTLNCPTLYHYLKFVRGKIINHLQGRVYAECWWEQNVLEKKVGGEKVEVIHRDQFNYDVIDPRRVRVSPEYTYSAREKSWIMVQKDKTFDWLEKNKKKFGYFNLDEIREHSVNKIQEQLRLKREDLSGEQLYNPIQDIQTIITRYGEFWAVVDERDEVTELPTKISYGYNEDGKVRENAELVESVLTFARGSGSHNVLIGFSVSKFIDSNGIPYKPIIRGLCYVHPTDDEGVGDGKYGRDLQTAIDDTFNLGNDRTMLATLPTFIGRKNSLTDNDDIYFEPEHVIPVENMDDLKEIKISDNINGALSQLGFLVGKLNQTMSIFPTTMGALPSASSTTATAVAGAESRTGMRTNYKSVTFENTFLCELYWMIQQMTHQFAREETAMKLMGQKAYDFDPSKEYWFKPVSQSVENEQSKQNKITKWIQLVGYLTNLQHPDAVKMINYILKQLFTYMGDEFVNFGNVMLNEQQPIQGGSGQQEASSTPMTNQSAVPQSVMEQMTRGGAGGY